MAWTAAGVALGISWVSLELAYWQEESDASTAPSMADDQRRLGTAYGALEKCLVGDRPLSTSDDAKLRLARVAAVAEGEWPKRCVEYAAAFREAAALGETWRFGAIDADGLARAVESGEVERIRDALESMRHTVRSFPRDEVAGVPEPRGDAVEIALHDAAILPGALGQSPGAIGHGPIRLHLQGGPICTFAIAPTADAKSVARCAYPRDAVPQALPYHGFLGDSAAAAPSLGIFLAAEDRALVAFELESGEVLFRGQEESVRNGGVQAVGAGYLDEGGGLTLLLRGDRPALVQRTADGKIARRALFGEAHWLVGDELFSLGAGAAPVLSVTSIAGDATPSPPIPIGSVESELDLRHPVSCGEGDTRFITFWKLSSEETVVIGGSAGGYRILSESGSGTAVTCHGKSTSVVSTAGGGFRRQTCDLDGCKEEKGWSPGGTTHAALAVDAERVLLVSAGEDDLIRIRSARASDIGKAAPTAVLYDWEYNTVRTSWLIGRGEAALLLIDTSHGVVPLRVDRDGRPTSVAIEWIEG